MKTFKHCTRFLCILALMYSLTNCQDDSVADFSSPENTEANSFPYVTTLISDAEVNGNTLLTTQMRNLQTLQRSGIAENGDSDLYNFTVDTDVVKFIENTENGSHSYTFSINRENSQTTNLENVVFSYNTATDDYDASLVTYHLSTAQLQELLQTDHVATSHLVTYQPIALDYSTVMGENFSETPCTSTYTVYHITPDTGETFLYSDANGTNVCEHENDDDPCEVYTVIEVDCPETANSSQGTDGVQSPSGPTTNNGTTGGSTNGSDSGSDGANDGGDDGSDNVVTSPLTRDEMRQITEELNETLGEGNWEFSDEPSNDENIPSFNSQEELEEYIESLSGTASAIESSHQNLQDGTTTTRFVFPASQYLSTANLKIDIITNLQDDETGEEFEVVGINSGLIGFSIMMSWERNEFYSVDDSVTDSNFKEFLVTGKLKRGILYYGLDITVKTDCIMTMNVNKYTGDEGNSNIVYQNY